MAFKYFCNIIWNRIVRWSYWEGSCNTCESSRRICLLLDVSLPFWLFTIFQYRVPLILATNSRVCPSIRLRLPSTISTRQLLFGYVFAWLCCQLVIWQLIHNFTCTQLYVFVLSKFFLSTVALIVIYLLLINSLCSVYSIFNSVIFFLAIFPSPTNCASQSCLWSCFLPNVLWTNCWPLAMSDKMQFLPSQSQPVWLIPRYCNDNGFVLYSTTFFSRLFSHEDFLYLNKLPALAFSGQTI